MRTLQQRIRKAKAMLLKPGRGPLKLIMNVSAFRHRYFPENFLDFTVPGSFGTGIRWSLSSFLIKIILMIWNGVWMPLTVNLLIRTMSMWLLKITVQIRLPSSTIKIWKRKIQRLVWCTGMVHLISQRLITLGQSMQEENISCFWIMIRRSLTRIVWKNCLAIVCVRM